MLRITARILPPVLAVVLLTACTGTQSKPPPFTFVGERLIADIPDTWQNILTLETENAWYADFIPPGQTREDWQTQLSFETFAQAQSSLDSDPLDILVAEGQEDEDRCEYVQHFNVFTGYENNYETAVRLFLCGENAFVGRGEVKLIKVIRGNHLVHAISLTQRVEPFTREDQAVSERVVADWSQYLNGIRLCDGTTEHPCPAPAPDDS